MYFSRLTYKLACEIRVHRNAEPEKTKMSISLYNVFEVAVIALPIAGPLVILACWRVIVCESIRIHGR